MAIYNEQTGNAGQVTANIHLRNLSIHCRATAGFTEGIIQVSGNCRLSLEGCIFRVRNSTLVVRPGACLDIDDCVFDGAPTSIDISPAAGQVIVKNSIFKGCGLETEYSYSSENACIQVSDSGYMDVDMYGLSYCVKLC